MTKAIQIILFVTIGFALPGPSCAEEATDVDLPLTGGTQPGSLDEWLPQATLLEPQDGQRKSFGYSVALDGNTALVGQADGVGTVSASRAYVFERDDEAWSEPVALQPAEHPLVCAVMNDFGDRQCPHFGWSVAVSGDVAVVGQPWTGSPSGGFNPRRPQGAAFVFVRQGDQWVEQAKLMASDGDNDDAFGWSVAVSGDTIVVGAPNRPARQPDRPDPDPHGAAYVFVRQGDNWVEQTRLFPDDFPLRCPRIEGQTQSYCPGFAWSVAIEGETALVGTPGAGDDPDPDRFDTAQGLVYVFTRDGGAWSQQARLVASDGNGGHFFGFSVALQAETALIGASFAGDDPSPINNPGAAYVFTRSGVTWTERQRLMPSDGGGLDRFGNTHGVALAGDIALVGAELHDTDGNENQQGAAYLYTRDDGIWTERQKLTAPPGTTCGGSGCAFGRAVALSGNSALVGADKVVNPDPGPVNSQGTAYLFVGPDFMPARIFRDGFEE